MSPHFPSYTDVRIVDTTIVLTTPPSSLSENLRAWLKQRKTEGESEKKPLLREALVLFVGLTTRMFDAAYRDVFGKSRGRPRKPPPK